MNGREWICSTDPFRILPKPLKHKLNDPKEQGRNKMTLEMNICEVNTFLLTRED